MLWEDDRFNWFDMTNQERIKALINDVFPTYLGDFVRFEPDRRRILNDFRVRADLFACSDPRINTDVFGCYPGEIFLKRAVGGKFNLGNPTLKGQLSRVLDVSERDGFEHILFISFHYSKSAQKKGCAGHGHNDNNAKKYATDLFKKMRKLFFQKRFVTPILCSIETDKGSVKFYGYGSGNLNCMDFYDKEDGEIYENLFSMYDGVSSRVLHYLLRCVKGNANYVRNLHPENLAVLQDHGEFAIGYGSGFFSFPRGRIMVVNPYSHPFSQESHLADAFSIQSKLQEKGIVKNGFILVSGSIYNRDDERLWAIEESLNHLETAKQLLQERFRHLLEIMTPFPIIMHRDSRMVTVISA